MPVRSEDPATAIAEVRPSKGELVSVAELRVDERLKILECVKYHDEDANYVLMNTMYDFVPGDDMNQTAITLETPSIKDVAKNVWTYVDEAYSASP